PPPSNRSRQTSSLPYWPRRRPPPPPPARATTDITRATERAFPCPFTAPRSACRQRGVLATSASMTGPVSVLTAGLVGSIAATSSGNRGGGAPRGARPPPHSAAPRLEACPP